MSLRTARTAARAAWHRMAHLDTLAALPPDGHKPAGCELDVDAGRLDAMLAAVWPILRRHAVQEFARRHGRRQLQLTPSEVSATRRALRDRQAVLAGAPRSRDSFQEAQAIARTLAKLADLEG